MLSLMDSDISVVAMIQMMNSLLFHQNRFYGTNFGHWKDKMKWFLTTMKAGYIINPKLPPIPTFKDGEHVERIREYKKNEEDKLVCRGHIHYLAHTGSEPGGQP